MPIGPSKNKFQKRGKFSAPEIVSQKTTKRHAITTFSPQNYHPETPHFFQTPFKNPTKTAKQAVSLQPQKLFPKSKIPKSKIKTT